MKRFHFLVDLKIFDRIPLYLRIRLQIWHESWVCVVFTWVRYGALFIISATSEASDFKVGMWLRFAKACYKHTHWNKLAWLWIRVNFPNFGVSVYYFCNV